MNCYFLGYELKRIENIHITSPDTTLLEVNMKKCTIIDTLKNCPIGNSKKHVIRTKPELMVSYSFASKRKEYKYAKKIQKQGYRTHIDNDEEVLLYVHDKNGAELLDNASGCTKYLFCKKHKLVFR